MNMQAEDQNEQEIGSDENQDSQEVFMDSRVVKTVRNLKKISSSTVKEQPPRIQLNEHESQRFDSHLQKPLDYQQQQQVMSQGAQPREETLEERINRIRRKNQASDMQQKGLSQVNSQSNKQLQMLIGLNSTKNYNAQNQLGQSIPINMNKNDVSQFSDQPSNHSFGQMRNQMPGMKFNQPKINQSKSTTANSNIDSQQAYPNGLSALSQANFERMQREQQQQQILGYGLRGCRPESNLNLEIDMLMVEQKKEKVLEIFKTSSLIHDIQVKMKRDETFRDFQVDSGWIIQLMMGDRHFVNLLSTYLAKKPPANKLEKFIAEKLELKVLEMQTETQIQNKLRSVNEMIEERLQKLKNMRL